MDDLAGYELDRGAERLDAARLLLREGKYEDAVNRAYYSMFHCARGLLYSRDISAKTHRGLIGKFGENLVKSGEIAREFAAMLTNAEALRESADYGIISEIGEEDTRAVVRDAEEFIKMSRELLAARGKH